MDVRKYSEVDVRDSDVSNALASLQGKVSRLHEVQSMVEGRLARILRTNVTTPEVENAKNPTEFVPLARDIKEMADQVGSITDAFMDMLNRLEV